jgi:hypothetical protein
MADSSDASGLAELSNQQILDEAAVRGLSDFAAAGRLQAIRTLAHRKGELPKGGLEKLQELASGDPDGSVHVLLAARSLLRQHNHDPGPLPTESPSAQ